MYIGYNEAEKFFRLLYDKPKGIFYESDFAINRNSGDYANEGLIYYTIEMDDIKTTQAFRRMSKIFQLGTKYLGDSNLMHSRAKHSKGTYARTMELFMHLLENNNIKGIIKKYGYEKYIVAELMRGFLHDIGHGPFSHTMETICNLPKGFHEDIGKRMINENEELKERLNAVWPNLPEIMEEVEKRNFLGLNSLFEGQIDVDRGDFLPRDSMALSLNDNNSDEITELLQKVEIKKVVIEGKGKLVPVYPYECLNKIEKFLESRFNNYQKYYEAPEAKVYDHIYKEFSEELLKCEEEHSLKTFLRNNYEKNPEEIDLDEYISYNDIEFLKGIIDVYDNTNNKKLKSLARICIPDEESYYALYYGLMVTNEDVNEYGNIGRLLPENDRFFRRIGKIPQGSTKALIKERYITQKCRNEKDLKYKLKEIRKELGEEGKFTPEDYGIAYYISKNSLYKNKKGEEIYVEDENGKIYTFDSHPKRKVELKNFTNVVIIVDKEKLKEKTKNEKIVQKVTDILRDRKKEAR